MAKIVPKTNLAEHGADERLHAFFDSTEVTVDGSCSPRLGRIGKPELRDAANAIGARLYVPDLVLDEVARQRLLHFKDELGRARALRDEISKHLTITIPPAPNDEEMLRRFRTDVADALAAVPARVIPVSPVTLEEVLALSKEEVPPLKNKKLFGFHDVVILLASIKYAQASGIRSCMFVSHDPGFNASAVQGLGTKYGVACQLQRDTDALVGLLRDLHAAQLRSLETELARITKDFMTAKLGVVQDYLNSHPLPVEEIVPFFLAHASGALFLALQPPLDVVALVVDRIDTALPDEVPGDGEMCAITFRTEVNAWAQPAGGQLGGFARLAYEAALRQDAIYDPSPLGSPPVIAGHAPFVATVPIIGKARARFEGGGFVGEPELLSISVSQPVGQLRHQWNARNQ